MVDDRELPGSLNGMAGCKLEHKTVGDIRGCFFVPAYQRGYRWDKEDVARLLDDIWQSGGRPYSLQPVVVKLRKPADSEAERVWSLIDGQQRLTTLFLILQYMKKHTACGLGAPYQLTYETRKGSEEYLKDPKQDQKDSNIDYYHLYRANEAIDQWFERQGKGDVYSKNSVAMTLHGYLFKSVGVIWYEASLSENETSLFTRLNIGRIPLTDAELVKAALLSKLLTPESSERAQEIAAQWDGIERDLHREDIWAFVAGLSAEAMDDRYPTRISLLLDTLADSRNPPSSGKRPRYQTFDTLRLQIEESPTAFWKGVVALHAQILGWFENPKIYNKIGFLVAASPDGAKVFGEIAKNASGQRRREFEAYLDTQISSLLDLAEEDLEKLSYEDKRRGYPKLMQLLLLMNVETVSNNDQRFPFARHVGHQWSLEHIHAQNADSLNQAKQWRAWLESHEKALDAVTTSEATVEITSVKSEIVSAVARIDNNPKEFTGQDFSALSGKILKYLNRDEAPDHSVCNMALLSRTDNSRLSNDVFEAKRQKILALDRAGKYVPVCTRNVFLKYYANADAQQPHFWSEQDKAAYRQACCDLLQKYFKPADGEKS